MTIEKFKELLKLCNIHLNDEALPPLFRAFEETLEQCESIHNYEAIESLAKADIEANNFPASGSDKLRSDINAGINDCSAGIPAFNELLKKAPESENNFFIVPNVM